jgi:hypothetical protein
MDTHLTEQTQKMTEEVSRKVQILQIQLETLQGDHRRLLSNYQIEMERIKKKKDNIAVEVAVS